MTALAKLARLLDTTGSSEYDGLEYYSPEEIESLPMTDIVNRLRELGIDPKPLVKHIRKLSQSAGSTDRNTTTSYLTVSFDPLKGVARLQDIERQRQRAAEAQEDFQDTAWKNEGNEEYFSSLIMENNEKIKGLDREQYVVEQAVWKSVGSVSPCRH